MMEGFVRISYENVFKGRHYDIDFGANSTFGLLRDVEVLSDPMMYGSLLCFDMTNGRFSQDVDSIPAYIREVR